MENQLDRIITDEINNITSFYNPIDDKKLQTVSMTELYDQSFQKRPPIIDGLILPGTYIFAGAPKLGKSFLMMQIAYHVATGTDMWGYHVHKGTVLYLALEDDLRRLQERLFRMFGTECADDLYLATRSDTLEGNLINQMESFRDDHPDTSLIIIDTLQKVKEQGNDKYSYANKKVYLEFMNSKKKASFRREHEPEIMLYEAATRELRKLLGGKPVPSEKTTSARIRELSQKKNEEYEELSEIKRRERSLQEKVINVRSIYDNRTDRVQQKRRDQELG